MSSRRRTLQIGWWNTGLSPVKSDGQELTDRASPMWEAVVAGVRALARLGVDVLLLGEVCPQDLADLKKAVAPSFVRVVKPARTDGRPSDIGALVGARATPTAFRSLNTLFKDKPLIGRQSHLTLAVEGVRRSPVTVFAVHWPSRRESTGASERDALGGDLQRAVARVGAHAIVLGDFNDEPFDSSVLDGLQSTRVRHASRERSTSSTLLYNPSWRLLGERHALEDEHPDRMCAGTHRWTGDYGGGWYTFDQVLVTADFLREKGWRLSERLLRIIEMDGLKTGQHHPVVCALEHVKLRSDLMAKFADSLKKGLDAAADAERARREIGGVLNDLARQIGEAMGVNLEISVVSREKKATHRYEGVLATITGQQPIPPSVDALRVGMRNGQHQYLCDFVRTPMGYPVDIEYADVIVSCHDKESLEQALASMLEHPDIARKIQAVVPAPPKSG